MFKLLSFIIVCQLSIGITFAQSDSIPVLLEEEKTTSSNDIKPVHLLIDTNQNHFGLNPLKWENKYADPKTASLLSLIPGGGQIYNFKFVKAPIVAGINLWMLQKYILARQDYLALKTYNDAVLQNTVDYVFYFKKLNNSVVVVDSAGLPPEVIKARGLRNLHFFTFAFTYVLNIMDARVDALTINGQKHSPVKAAYYSALIPGSGQLYNRKYWKIPFIYGIGSYFLYQYNKVNLEYQLLNEQYIAAITSSDDGATREQESLKRQIKQVNLDKEKQLINLFLIYLANVVDASVDAHFTGFSVDDDINISVVPYSNPIQNASGFQMILQF